MPPRDSYSAMPDPTCLCCCGSAAARTPRAKAKGPGARILRGQRKSRLSLAPCERVVECFPEACLTSHVLALTAQSAENSCLGRFHLAGVNIEGGPEKNADVSLRRKSQDFHPRITEQQCVAEGRTAAGFVERDDQKIRVHTFDSVNNVLFVLNLSDDFDVGLFDDGF